MLLIFYMAPWLSLMEVVRGCLSSTKTPERGPLKGWSGERQKCFFVKNKNHAKTFEIPVLKNELENNRVVEQVAIVTIASAENHRHMVCRRRGYRKLTESTRCGKHRY